MNNTCTVSSGGWQGLTRCHNAMQYLLLETKVQYYCTDGT